MTKPKHETDRQQIDRWQAAAVKMANHRFSVQRVECSGGRVEWRIYDKQERCDRATCDALDEAFWLAEALNEHPG